MSKVHVELLKKAKRLIKSREESFICCAVESGTCGLYTQMAIESPTLSESQITNVRETCAEMERVLEGFPEIITRLKNLGSAFTHFVSSVSNNKTQLIESLYLLRRLHKAQLFH